MQRIGDTRQRRAVHPLPQATPCAKVYCQIGRPGVPPPASPKGGGCLMSEIQLRAIGPDPTVADLFVGALLYSTVAEVLEVVRYVNLEDIDEPGQAVFESVVALARRAIPPSSQLVLDDIKRRGKLTRTRGLWLASATASGACASAARAYAAALVAESLRRQTESLGHALVTASATYSEVEISKLAETGLTRLRYVAGRLTELRGDAE
jgi:hypothetical protein